MFRLQKLTICIVVFLSQASSTQAVTIYFDGPTTLSPGQTATLNVIVNVAPQNYSFVRRAAARELPELLFVKTLKTVRLL